MLIPDDVALEALIKRLHLAYIRQNWREVVDRAERESWSYRDFLAVLAEEEVAHRAQTGIARRKRKARFPFLKTIEEFDFRHQTALRQLMLGSFLGPEFVATGQNLVLFGKPGRGKTHLAIAIAYKAILNGHDALFTTAAQLIEDLSVAADKSQLHDALKRYIAPDILVVDEVGYLTLRHNAANVLYHVVNRRYLKGKPIIFTTNKPLTKWGRVLHDEDLAAAILDRVLHNGRLIVMDGPSVRTLGSTLSLDSTSAGARISGSLVPELTEPTLEEALLADATSRHDRDAARRRAVEAVLQWHCLMKYTGDVSTDSLAQTGTTQVVATLMAQTVFDWLDETFDAHAR